MKTVVDYLKEHTSFTGYAGRHKIRLGFDRYENVILKVDDRDHLILASPKDTESLIQEILENDYETEIRFCDECGKPYDAGFMGGDGEWYCCEDCFEPMMDRNFGKGKWRPTEKEGRYGGYYEYLTDSGKWEDTGAFYTEWN